MEYEYDFIDIGVGNIKREEISVGFWKANLKTM